MKKLIAIFALFVGLSANANMISIEISDTNVSVGEVVSVNLLATNFEDFDTFDFDFDFDTSVFNYDPTSLASALDFGLVFEVNQVADGMALSFLDFFPVSGSFLLASFDLIAVGEGSTSFSFSDVSFSDSFFATDLEVNTSARDAAKVSAPATLGLFAMAAIALIGFRRKA